MFLLKLKPSIKVISSHMLVMCTLATFSAIHFEVRAISNKFRELAILFLYLKLQTVPKANSRPYTQIFSVIFKFVLFILFLI